METITFYSYKGGTGRTLAVANAAKYFALFGKRVFVVDLDLEAPGLHYKLRLGESGTHPAIERGALDYVYESLRGKGIPDAIAPYTVEVPAVAPHHGSVTLMPAGNVRTANYWRRLAELNWFDMFYKGDSPGIPFFLEFRERIRAEYEPDFLLIDSRTGISEIGGVATTLLPDQVVCLLLHNEENLEGAREVLRGIQQSPRLPKQAPVKIVAVLTRIPERGNAKWESEVIARVREFLLAEASDPSRTLGECPILELHSEPELQYAEALRIGGDKTVEESPLLRDYLRLFPNLLSEDVILSQVGEIVRRATERALDDPDSAEKDLETLAATCPHPETYRALLRFYRLRSKSADLVLRTAWTLWTLTQRSHDSLLWDVIRREFEPSFRFRRKYSVPLRFVESVWDAFGSEDVEVGLKLADSYVASQENDLASEVISRLLTNTDADEETVAACVNRLVDIQNLDLASAIVGANEATFGDGGRFCTAWARMVVAKRDSLEAKKFVESKSPLLDDIRKLNIRTYTRLLQLAERRQELENALQESLSEAITDGHVEKLVEVGTAFGECGRDKQFQNELRKAIPAEIAEEVLRSVRGFGTHFRRRL
mgnify:CR=1 FL=1